MNSNVKTIKVNLFQPLIKTKKIFDRWPLKQGLQVAIAKTLAKGNVRVNRRLLEEEDNYVRIEKKGYHIAHLDEHLTIQKSASDRGILIRRFSTDSFVFTQIFIHDEFEEFISFIGDGRNIKTIIDAGANIGISSVKLQSYYPTAKLISIEPDPGNFKMLEKNIALNKLNAVAIQSAVWSSSTRLYFDRTFRDGREWSVTVTEAPNEGEYLQSISLNEIVDKYRIDRIDILKIDVEGSEKEIFKIDDDTIRFLDITKFIAVEVHEECVTTKEIEDILIKKGFELAKSGEYLIGRNKKL